MFPLFRMYLSYASYRKFIILFKWEVPIYFEKQNKLIETIESVTVKEKLICLCENDFYI